MQRSINGSRIPQGLFLRHLKASCAPPVGREPQPASRPEDVLSPRARLYDTAVSETPHAPLPPPAGAAPSVKTSRAWQNSVEMAIPKPRVQPYAHRTFMGLAGSMLRDSAWSACLARCMPELHAECTGPGVSITRAMRLLEGNPVLAAYGLARGDNKALPMEWDLWLDPAHPENLSLARVIHGNAAATDLANSAEGKRPDVAASVMAGTRPGTDVHSGLTPMAWLHVFREAARMSNTPVSCGAVYLDVKSAWSGARDVAAFVAALQNEQVQTRGVLAFNFDQLAAPLCVPHAVHLAHSAAGLATLLPGIPRGAMAMFNGGALLNPRARAPMIDAEQLELARTMSREHGLRIGLYLQEDSVSPDALRVLIDCINQNDNTFASGIAYGGLAGVAEGLIGEGTGTGCQTQVIAAENAAFFKAFAM